MFKNKGQEKVEAATNGRGGVEERDDYAETPQTQHGARHEVDYPGIRPFLTASASYEDRDDKYQGPLAGLVVATSKQLVDKASEPGASLRSNELPNSDLEEILSEHPGLLPT
jgi:hypothetical protein